MHHSRQDALDAAARARAGHAAEWHPVLAAVEQRPGCWHLTTPYGAEYAVLQIVRVGGELGYRAVTFAPTSEQRQLIGYYRTLRAAAANAHRHWLSTLSPIGFAPAPWQGGAPPTRPNG